MRRYAKLAARLRVPSGFLVAALYLFFSQPARTSLAAGLPLALAGLLLRAWAAGHLAKNEALAATGPFACTRHPLYLGSLTVGAGFALAGWNLWLALLLFLYFVLFYLPVMGEEESHLRALFPEYAAYASRVPRFWPRLASGCAAAGNFRWSLYLRNREYQGLVGYMVAAAILVGKLHRA